LGSFLGTARVLVGLVAVGLAARVTAQSSPALTPATFLVLLERYRQGDLDSLSDAARFPSRDVARVTAAMRGRDQASARATLVFTLDLTRMAPVQEVADLVEASRRLGKAIAGQSDPAFMREAVLCQVAALAHAEEFERAHWTVEAAFHTWPGDPDLLLARGSLWETVFERRSREWMGNQPWAEHYESLTLERLARLAAADFERVAGSAGSQPEARLRLGRMLMLRQKYSDARPVLERARTEADHQYLRYLASLFLGQLDERVGQYFDAERAYRDAYQQYPAAQAVTLSLARLLILRGVDAEADALILAMFEARRSPGATPDPWGLYDFGQFWRLEQRVANLRAQIKR
jgi:tetratricopeptide (TPR) repeat protein